MLAEMTSGKEKLHNDENLVKVELAGAITDAMTVLPPQDSRTYADSRDSPDCFHNIDSFYSGSLEKC